MLIAPDLYVADQANCSEAKPVLSFSLYVDGKGTIAWQFATFNGENGKKMNLAKNSNKNNNMFRQLYMGKKGLMKNMVDMVIVGSDRTTRTD